MYIRCDFLELYDVYVRQVVSDIKFKSQKDNKTYTTLIYLCIVLDKDNVTETDFNRTQTSTALSIIFKY